ncbi:MAG: ribonuclease D [Anaerolineales bacterium]
MSNEQLPEPILIKRQQALHRLAESLLHERILAVDTESNSLYAYQEQVCLIQFSTTKRDFLVDPLSLDDLSPLGPIFSSPRIEKVFHAAEYDLICLKRDFDFDFSNLFDTMLAARILGREAIGLGAMLESEFGVKVDKRHQRANWGQRPLPEHLLHYAQLDTHYLIALRDHLRENLVEENLLALAQEDFSRICKVDERQVATKPDDCWRISGATDLPGQKAAILQELCSYRDQAARSANRPLFKVIGDKTLLQIAQQTPTSITELGKVQGMTSRQVERHGRGLLAAVRKGSQMSPIYPPHNRRPDNGFLERLEALRDWRKKTARKMGVNSDVILPRDLLHAVASKYPHRPEDLAQMLSEVPWRYEHFGRQILEVVRGAES